MKNLILFTALLAGCATTTSRTSSTTPRIVECEKKTVVDDWGNVVELLHECAIDNGKKQ